MIGLGVLLVIITGRADQLGLGRYPGFGWLQALGVVIGVVVLLAGLHLRKAQGATVIGAAKALGLTIPPTLLQRADQLID